MTLKFKAADNIVRATNCKYAFEFLTVVLKQTWIKVHSSHDMSMIINR